MNVPLFERQVSVNSAVDDMVAKFSAIRESMHIVWTLTRIQRPLSTQVSASHGLLAGNISFTDWSGAFVQMGENRIGHVPILPSKITGIRSTAEFILIVEKECTFEVSSTELRISKWISFAKQIVQSQVHLTLNCIVITVCQCFVC